MLSSTYPGAWRSGSRTSHVSDAFVAAGARVAKAIPKALPKAFRNSVVINTIFHAYNVTLAMDNGPRAGIYKTPP